MINSISLKTLAENIKLVSEVKKVYSVKCITADENVDSHGEVFGMFEFGELKPFIGAISNGKIRKIIAVLLQYYYDSVVFAPEEEAVSPFMCSKIITS